MLCSITAHVHLSVCLDIISDLKTGNPFMDLWKDTNFQYFHDFQKKVGKWQITFKKCPPIKSITHFLPQHMFQEGFDIDGW